MNTSLQQLVEISNFYGTKSEFVIAGGGNTSYKDEEKLYVKASGVSLGNIDPSGFVELDRSILQSILTKKYDGDETVREQQVKSDLLKSRVYPEKNQRPSVEASVHNAIRYPFVVHLHPTIVNGLTCSRKVESWVKRIFKEEVVFLEYITPGYILFQEIEERNDAYFQKYGKYPKVFLLQNHGIFVGGDTTEEIKNTYTQVLSMIQGHITGKSTVANLAFNQFFTDIVPGIRAALSVDQLLVCRARYSTLIENYIKDRASFEKIAKPFTPDGIVYCNPYPLYVEREGTADEVLSAFTEALRAYRSQHGYDPKMIFIKGLGMIAIGENVRMAETRLDVFEDIMKMATYAESFGGPNPMREEDIRFIEKWEVEAYRKKLLSKGKKGRVENKVAVVTGGAQGFGKGIVEGLAREGANVVVLDINREKGEAFVRSLRDQAPGVEAVFIQADITDSQALHAAASEVIVQFGGLDLLISNAGVLYAGGLEELEEDHFDLVTRVNYKGFYLCVKHLSRTMKLQATYNPNMFADIIQINSKSGLEGSNKNFAYAGGKFGGIGLTQSFAKELVAHRIKVNAICPGNYFEGPLWSDGEKGLFVQYLKAGKVPGAKSVEDVKHFYEDKVPMKRGCGPEDVLEAIYYIVDQKYETGQAVPVTGGQNMLH